MFFEGQEAARSLIFRKFPCIFPVTREFWAETGSSQTASATIQSSDISRSQSAPTTEWTFPRLGR